VPLDDLVQLLAGDSGSALDGADVLRRIEVDLTPTLGVGQGFIDPVLVLGKIDEAGAWQSQDRVVLWLVPAISSFRVLFRRAAAPAR
jgi:hypothetical protein